MLDGEITIDGQRYKLVPVDEKKKPEVRWRAKGGETYWFATLVDSYVDSYLEKFDAYDNKLFEQQNYFDTREAAQAAADAIKALLAYIHSPGDRGIAPVYYQSDDKLNILLCETINAAHEAVAKDTP